MSSDAGSISRDGFLRSNSKPFRAMIGFAPTQRFPEIAGLLATHRAKHPRADNRFLTRAYEVAELAHRGQMRKSGEAYITHPLAVAEILAELGMDTQTLAAALLHDTVEDTDYTLTELRSAFGHDVAHLVDGVTKLDKVRFGSAAEAETIRKTIIAAGKDMRVLMIKLADRLHNMRTLGFKSRASQERIALATREVLIPLAGRLGVHVLKRQLEDLVLATLHPEAFTLIRDLVNARAATRAAYLESAIDELGVEFRANKIRATVGERPRHYHSIHENMVAAGVTDQVCDNPRIQIVIDGDDITDCYTALGVVHGHWRPVRGRFKDHISVPKFNLYQSLHTTVIGPDGLFLDVMIRTEAMHKIAEYGIVAFRRSAGEKAPTGIAYAATVGELDWLQRLLDWEADAVEPGEFLDSLRFDLSDHEVLVFTPKGESVSLPNGSTPVDFAYALSTWLGDRSFGARVNGQLAPLSGCLADGDVVEILTAPAEYPGPAKEWLEFVRSPRAHIQIRRWFNDADRADAVAIGRSAIAGALVECDRMLTQRQPLMMLAHQLGLSGVDALYAAVGEGEMQAAEVVQQLIAIVDAPGAGEA